MRQSQSLNSKSELVANPICPKCSVHMMLTRVDPDEPGYDKRTFECQVCNREQSIVVKFK